MSLALSTIDKFTPFTNDDTLMRITKLIMQLKNYTFLSYAYSVIIANLDNVKKNSNPKISKAIFSVDTY